MTDEILDTAVCFWRTLREFELSVDCRLIRVRLNKIFNNLTESQRTEYWERTNAIIRNGGKG